MSRLDLSALIAQHVLPDGSVAVTPRAARWVENRLGLTQEQRLLVRDDGDHELYAVLSALHLSAVGGDLLAARSANGTKVAEPQQVPQESEVWLTTVEAAQVAGVTDRCIRKWIAAQQLPAKRHGRSWRINRQQLNITQAIAA